MTEQVKLEPCRCGGKPWKQRHSGAPLCRWLCDRCVASTTWLDDASATSAWQAMNASRAGEWNADMASAPKDGRWLLAASNDHTQHFRIRWGQRDTGYYWLTEGGRYYGDGLFGGWIEYPRTLRKEP